MRPMLLALCVVTWAAPSQAAQGTKPKAPDNMADFEGRQDVSGNGGRKCARSHRRA